MKNAAYVISKEDLKTGEILGQVENSFSMGSSDSLIRVYIYSPNSIVKKTKREFYNGLKKWASGFNSKRYRYRVYRVGSKKCPFSINWKDYIAYKSGKTVPKYNRRNFPFTLKT